MSSPSNNMELADQPIKDHLCETSSSIPAGVRAAVHVSTLHVSLPTGASRVIVIGDVHACLRELMQLLEDCEYSPDNHDVVILVGDLLRKGPHSAEVVQFARQEGFYSVLGNHDDVGLKLYRRFKESGEIPKVDKFGSSDFLAKLSPEDVVWLEKLPLTITLPDHNNTVIVHAGLVPGVPLRDQKRESLYELRNIEVFRNPQNPDGAMEYKGVVGKEEKGEPWAKVWQGVGIDWSIPGHAPVEDTRPRFVIFGHDAPRGLQQEEWALGLDTNCCDGGKLTACILSPDGERTLKSVAALGKMVGIDDSGVKEYRLLSSLGA